MKLTAKQCDNARYLSVKQRAEAVEHNKNAKKAKDKVQQSNKLFDGGGLYLEVAPTGSRVWRMKYRHHGKEKRLTIGKYPLISLQEAREAREAAKKQLHHHIDPSEQKRLKKLTSQISSENTFEGVAREWHEKQLESWTEGHAKALMKRLEKDIFPKIGHRPIAEIEAPELLAVLRLIEKRGAIEVAHKAKQTSGQIFRYAIATSRAKHDPSAALKGALKTRKVKHHSYIDERELPIFLKRLESYDGDKLTQLALKITMLTFTRTIELRGALWEEINWEKKEWRIPAERMKMKRLHVVPLATQTIALLRQVQNISGNRQHIFPNSVTPSKIMSENTLLYALYRMGYHSRATVHGFRATASTILNENGLHSAAIERQMDHRKGNKVKAAYDHAKHLPARRELMQWWGDYLEKQGLKI